MASNIEIPIEQGVVHIRFTDRIDGDFRVDLPTSELRARQARVHPQPWSWLRQTHSADQFLVTKAGESSGQDGDGLLTVTPNCPISITTADCAPVVLVAMRGVATVHAGWRGLLAGIVEQTAEHLRRIAGEPVTAVLGPCIQPDDYEFGSNDLSKLSRIYGSEIEGKTSGGSPALNLAAAVEQALKRCDWAPSGADTFLDVSHHTCTSSDRWFSHRTRGDKGRQAAVAWIEA